MTVEIDGANNIVKTNTISEVTSANGVTVDGLNIKDSKLVTANSVIQTNITDQAINEAKMQISNAPTNGYFLSAQSGNTGGLTWAEAGEDNTPAFDVRLASNQTIANNTFTKLAFATEILDSDGKFASNKFTPTIAGYYFLTYSIYYDVVDDNEILSLKIYKNGSGDNATERNNFATGTNNDIMVWGTYLIYLDADDYIELFTKQGSGGDATAYTGNTTFSGFRVSGV